MYLAFQQQDIQRQLLQQAPEFFKVDEALKRYTAHST
jgi:hypothetical protein